jgi:hypothetical protein
MTTLAVPGLPFPLTHEGSPPCQHRVSDGALVMTAAARTDLFADPAGGQPPAAPGPGMLLGTPPDGDFTIAARVTVGFRATFDAGVLLVHAGERRWAKLCFEFSPQREPTAVTVVTRGASDDCNSFAVAASTLWLRVARTGRAWAFHASQDGRWWRMVRYFSLESETGPPMSADTGGPGDPVRVGFLAQSPTGDGCTATFDHISLLSGAPADLRDGS